MTQFELTVVAHFDTSDSAEWAAAQCAKAVEQVMGDLVEFEVLEGEGEGGDGH